MPVKLYDDYMCIFMDEMATEMAAEINGDSKADNIISEPMVKTENRVQGIESRINHSRDDLNICGICNEQFPSVGTLDEHILIHTNVIRQISRATGVHIPLSNLQKNEGLTTPSHVNIDKNEMFTQLPTGHTLALDQSSGSHSQGKVTNVNNFQGYLSDGDTQSGESSNEENETHQQTTGSRNNVTVKGNNPTDHISSELEASHPKEKKSDIGWDARKRITTQRMPESPTLLSRDKKKECSESRKGLHACNICGRTFKNSGHLKDHIRVHTGEKPYCCKICKRSFTQKCNMKRHMVIHATPGENSIRILEKRSYKKSENPPISHFVRNKDIKDSINASPEATDNLIAHHSVTHSEGHVDSEDETYVDFECVTPVNGNTNIQKERSSNQCEKPEDETINKQIPCNHTENCPATDNAYQQRSPNEQFTNTDFDDELDVEAINAKTNEIIKQPHSTDSLRSESHTLTENLKQIAHRSEEQLDKIDAFDLHTREHATQETDLSDIYHEKFEVQNSSENTRTCDLCNKQFKSHADLQEHRALHSDKDRCSQFEKLQLNNRNKNNMHFGSVKRLHACTVCNRKFKSTGHLKAHIRIHTGERPYCCTICKRSFTLKSNMKRHMLIHEKPGVNKFQTLHTCTVCNRKFNSVGRLKEHIGIHTGERPYSCTICKRSFTFKSNLKRHMLIHEKPGINKLQITHTCTVCNRKCKSAGRLKEHIRIHTGERPFCCSSCEKSFTTMSNLNRHNRLIHENNEVNTPKLRTKKSSDHSENLTMTVSFNNNCTKLQSNLTEESNPANRVNLRQSEHQIDAMPEKVINVSGESEYDHSIARVNEKNNKSSVAPYNWTGSPGKDLTSYNGGEYRDTEKLQNIGRKTSKLYTCDICGRKGIKYKWSHLRIHTEKSHPCPICGKMFRRKGDIKIHMPVHAKHKPYACDICGKQLTQLNDLRNHLIAHTGEKRFVCEICGKRFIWQSCLRSHIKLHTLSKETQCTCDLCNKSFASKDRLRMHIAYTHLKKKTFQCNLCNKTFKFRSKLNSHMVIHSDEKPHECEVCKKCFKESGLLRKHMFSHSGQQPFSCKLCDKKFKRAENLRTHMLIHDGKKPHSCHICGANFRQKGSVKIHIMRVHDKM